MLCECELAAAQMILSGDCTSTAAGNNKIDGVSDITSPDIFNVKE